MTSELAQRANAVGILIRSGFTPEASLAAAGLSSIQHTGLLPVTLQSEAAANAAPTGAQAEPQVNA